MRINSTPSIQECAHTGRVPQSARLFVCLLWIIAFTSCNDQVSGSLPSFADFSFEQVQRTQTVLFTAGGVAAGSYVWSFGDGMDQQTGAFTHHTFCVAGEYDVRLELNGPGGEDSLMKTIVVEPVPGEPATGGFDLCTPVQRQLIFWADTQTRPPVGDCPDPTVMDIDDIIENLTYGDEVDRSVESPCDCFGIELPELGDLPEPESVQFRHVAPDGTEREICERTARFALGLEPMFAAACSDPDDIYFDSNGRHSITATQYDGANCDGNPMNFSAVRQFTIVP